MPAATAVKEAITAPIKSAKGQTSAVKGLFEKLSARDPAQTEFLQAVEEVFESLEPVIEKHPEYLPILERLCEPERQLMFRVAWVDDKGNPQVNRGFRVQMNSAIGPYKGGLRLDPSVNLSIIKFLAFEQTFKNALTTLPMGSGKGGSDFNPKGKTDNEVMKFCQSFMTELFRHIGAHTDVPAGDIGVGAREIGFLYGQYKRLANESVGVLTGKGLTYGGSLIRPEATGYGCCYYGEEIMKDQGTSMKGKTCIVTGSGNVAQYAVEKLLEMGAVVLTMSDSSGVVYEPEGFTREGLEQVMDIKTVKRTRLSDYKSDRGKYYPGKKPSHLTELDKVDVALLCATQNEVDEEDAKALVKMGVKLVLEGANMPSTSEAIAYYHKNNVTFAPGKAANAGGVAVSGLEMAQNSAMLPWSSDEVDKKLKGIMASIYAESKKYAEEYKTTLQAGANIAGFVKVATAMLAQGVV